MELMYFSVLFLLLCFSIEKGNGIHPLNTVYRNQTWGEAANDSTCPMIGLNLTGEVEDSIDNVTSNIVMGKYQTAWIGAYVKRIWINFENCYYGMFKNNTSWLTMASSGDPAQICLKHCNYSRFVLADGKCVCYKDVKVFSQTGCIAKQCTNTKYTYCGKGTAFNSRNITFQCMCRFNKEDYLSNLFGKGDCLAVTHEPKQLIAMNCSNTYKPVCYDLGNNQIDLSKSSSNWLQSLSECYARNKQFAGHGKTTNLTGIPNGTYWIGTFAVTYTFWGRPRAVNDSCVAVNIDRTNNHLTTVVLPCDTLLPALCINKSMFNNNTEVTTQQYDTSTTVPSRFVTTQSTQTIPSQITPTNSSEENHDQTIDIPTEETHTHQVPTIVGSVVGSIVGVAICAAVVLFLWRGRAFRKCSTETDNSLSNVEYPIASSIFYRETEHDNIRVSPGENVYENSDMCTTNEADTPERVGYTESQRSVRQETTGSGVYINGAVMYQPEVLTEQNPESDYCGLRLPSHDEHEYGQLE